MLFTSDHGAQYWVYRDWRVRVKYSREIRCSRFWRQLYVSVDIFVFCTAQNGDEYSALLDTRTLLDFDLKYAQFQDAQGGGIDTSLGFSNEIKFIIDRGVGKFHTAF